MRALYTTSHKFSLLSLLLLFTIIAWGQDHVRLINGAGYLSDAAVNTASGRLSTELPDHDVHITYVTNFVNIPDRYSIYDSLGLIPFTQVPNTTEGFPPATQEEKDAAINAAIHEAMTTINTDDNTIHIIYATAISLNDQAAEVVQSRKFLHFGNNVKRTDEMKVKQIIPSPELEVLSDSLQNDQYLADYVEELIAALNDPNYVINGSVEYAGDIYFSGDTIFYFHPIDELITTQVSDLQKLKLLINENYPVSPISWSEVESIPLAGSIITNNSPFTDANLTLKRDHFSGISKLQASYGSATTTIWFSPINLQLELSSEAIVETHTLEPLEPEDFIDVRLTNNGFLWSDHPSIYLQLSLAEPAFNGMSIFSTSPFPAGIAPEYTWDWSEEVCNTLRFIATAQRPVSGVMSDRIKEIRVKCEFEIANINIVPTFDALEDIDNYEDYTLNYNRTVNMGDTLYIVTRNNVMDRNIQFNVEWELPAPQEEDFWANAPNSIGSEPVWYFGSPGLHDWDVAKSPFNFNRLSQFTATYNSSAYPGLDGAINIDIGEADVNYYKAGIRAFNQHKFFHLAFLRENRRSLAGDIPIVLDLLNNWIGNGLENIVEGIRRTTPLNPSLETSIGVEVTTFNTEDSGSPKYHNNKETAGKARIAASTGKIPIGPLWIRSRWVTFGPFIEFDIGVYGAYEFAEQKLFNKEEYQPSAKSIEGGIDGGLMIGISLEIGDSTMTMGNPDANTSPIDAGGGIIFDVNFTGSYPAEVKLKKQWDYQDDGTYVGTDCTIAEFNHGPASLTATLALGATVNWGDDEYDINIFNFQHNWPITDKVFNKCNNFSLNPLDWGCKDPVECETED